MKDVAAQPLYDNEIRTSLSLSLPIVRQDISTELTVECINSLLLQVEAFLSPFLIRFFF